MRNFVRNLAKKILGKNRFAFPWYDSPWLSNYLDFRHKLKKKFPYQLERFDKSMEVFRTPMNYKIKKFESIFDQEKLLEIKRLIKELKKGKLEAHEIQNFGRFVVHNHEYFNQLQKELTDFVSQAVGEEVELNYNFLSLYSKMGVCKVHMDAPVAKWTLDVCIDQSRVWPIYFSKIEPWPEAKKYQKQKDWSARIKNGRKFIAHNMEPGDGVIFSGSSQWHYREAIKNPQKNDFCHLIFFHFIPKGTKQLLKPENWEKEFCR